MEAALHRGKVAVLAERFDGIDALAGDAGRKREAGQARLVVDQHGAGAALAAVAAGFCSGQADDFPQIVQQQQIVGHRVHARAAVERELENACQWAGHVPLPIPIFGTPFKSGVAHAGARAVDAAPVSQD